MGTPSPLVNTTPFPNRFFDLMPSLTGSEWVLLCLVVRQTYGWQGSDGRRKRSDWLTNAAIQRRTGRSSTAVSHAIEALVRKGVLEVRDSNGNMLQSPAERRRSRRLYFSIIPRRSGVVTKLETKGHTSIKESGYKKVATTKETENKKKRDIFVDATLLQGQENYKDHAITKREGNKEETDFNNALGSTQHADVSPGLKTLLARYKRDYVSRFDSPIPRIHRHDLACLQSHIERHGLKKLKTLLEAFFVSDFSPIRNKLYSISAFVQSVNVLLLARQYSPRNTRADETGHPRET